MRQINITPEMRVSYSEIKKFMLCSQEHEYAYTRRIEKNGNKSEALERGLLMHSAMGQYCEHRMTMESSGKFENVHMFAALQTSAWLKAQEWDEFEKPLADKVFELFSFFTELNPFEGYRIRSFEQSFGIMLPTGKYYVFSPDLILEHIASGRLYIVDFKTIYRFYNYGTIDLDMQLPSYVWGLREMGLDVADAMFLQFYHGFPAKTTDASKVIRLSPLNVTDQRIEVMVEQIYNGSASIEAHKGMPTLRASNDLVCNRCPFQKICIEELNQRDTDALFPVIYREKEPRDMEGVYVND